MSRALFNVTYEIATPESSEHGEPEEAGFLMQAVGLRVAVQCVRATRTNKVDGIESITCDSAPCVRPAWITVTNGQEFETAAHESRSLHIPELVTASSARRIARLLGAKL